MPSDRQQLKKKICMIGAFGVGKTSLVRNFVHSIFDESYLSTIGVKIDRKVVAIGEIDVNLVIWDLAGEEEFYQIPTSYLTGASGYFLVVDGTRPKTLDVALKVKRRIEESVSEELPFLLLLNKGDLTDEWAMSEDSVESLESRGLVWHRTSAKTGENVENAFVDLATRLI